LRQFATADFDLSKSHRDHPRDSKNVAPACNFTTTSMSITGRGRIMKAIHKGVHLSARIHINPAEKSVSPPSMLALQCDLSETLKYEKRTPFACDTTVYRHSMKNNRREENPGDPL